MVTLWELFLRHGAGTLRCRETLPIEGAKEVHGHVTVQLHYDFESRAKYVSLYVADMPDVSCPEAIVLIQLSEIVDRLTRDLAVSAGFPGEEMNTEDLVFTGQIYIYSERPVAEELIYRLRQESDRLGHRLVFRSDEFVKERNRVERPQAFICHDSQDKTSIAGPLAIELQKLMCPVWYDEYSLKVGDSLRDQIEKGLTECPKCILILTQNFLGNKGWTKREYDSIFTREVVEKKKVILPVWHGVSVEDVYKYSPILANTVAAKWELGLEEVARRLSRAIQK